MSGHSDTSAEAGLGGARGVSEGWRLGLEVGGTFTDGVGVSPGGEVRRVKVLSSGVVRVRAERVGPDGWRLKPAGVARGWDLRGFEARIGASRGVVASQVGDEVIVEWAGAVPDGEGGGVMELTTGEAPTVVAARLLTGTPAGVALPFAEVRCATTRATNALLEGRLTPTVLMVTRGFGDLLTIGDQRRPELFALEVVRPPALVAGVVEVDERLDARGGVIREMDEAAALEAARGWLSRGVRAAAVVLLHAWRNPAHEERLARGLRGIGFEHVSSSAALSPRIKAVPRGRTAAINAALSGAIEGLVRGTRAGWGDGAGASVAMMTSAGGLVDAGSFAPKDSLLSGPAGGAAGAAAVARRAGLPRVIALDMGGTSTDVTRIDEEPEVLAEHRVGPHEVQAPALGVHSVAAGGGSVCRIETVPGVGADGRAGWRPVVGPGSAGADPGPACYGRGGPLTLTDVNLLLGRVAEEDFESPVSMDAARGALARVRVEAERAGAMLPGAEEVLEALVAVADERVGQAIRAISVRQGYDPRGYALAAFGGAGGQHACAVAESLGIARVLAPAEASVLCAAGLHAARAQWVEERQVLAALRNGVVEGAFAEAESRARAAFERANPGVRAAGMRRTARLRLVGQDRAVDVEWAPGVDVAAGFAGEAERLFGYALGQRAIEVESVRVVVLGAGAELPAERGRGALAGQGDGEGPGRVGTRRVYVGGAWREVPVVCAGEGALVPGGEGVAGPAVVRGRWTSVLVPGGMSGGGWRARGLPSGDVLVEKEVAPAGASVGSDGAAGMSEDVRAELVGGRLDATARAMGELLGRVALSTNVKERLDYSCALLDARGRLVVSAPHIPVHLGALGVCVRRVAGAVEMRPGDVVITNHPAYGGSHLPDITLVAPAHDGAGRLIGYAACRAHHADVGGTRPGSMPPEATRLEEEGVVIPPRVLVRDGVTDWTGVRGMLEGAKHPARRVEDNLADLAAQIAAVGMGVNGLAALAKGEGAASLERGMRAVLSRAARGAREAVAALGAMDAQAERCLDDGARVRVRVRSTGDGALRVAFEGSAGVHQGNLNAPAGVIHSAVMYVVRLLVARSLGRGRGVGGGADVPLCDGLMEGVELEIPEGMLNPPWGRLGDDPASLPAVAGGNVETSQVVVNALLAALGVCADSQGTMNNVLFGSAGGGQGSASHYETIGGGSGAGPGFAGCSGVHTHMTNTAITDPEVLEHRFPVRLERFEIRRGSGGKGGKGGEGGEGGEGGWAGGDGLVREWAFLEPMSVSLLGTNRVRGPRGGAGGGDGAPGAHVVVRADGRREVLGSVAGFEAAAGDRLIVETPGGGGWGRRG